MHEFIVDCLCMLAIILMSVLGSTMVIFVIIGAAKRIFDLIEHRHDDE